MNTTPPTAIAQQITEAIDRLPLALQRLVLEFAEFLLSHLGPETETNESVDLIPSVDATADRTEKLLASAQRNAITLPPDYQFNRDEIYDR